MPMDSPFPGMNPYLEEPSFWPDVHHELIAAIREQIQDQLSAAYRAVITPYVAFESIEITPTRRFVPDVAVLERASLPSAGSSAAVAEAPMTLPAFMTVPVEYARIEIRSVRDQVLITAIELLSPANKRMGQDGGAHAYEQKRQEIFFSTAHLLELDLLRAGQRPQVARPLPAAPYFIFLSRMQRRPNIEIWPVSLRTPFPVVPVPLRHPEPPVALDLNPVIHAAYRRARYDLEIDYNAPPPAPELPPDDAVWLDALLRTHGLRTAAPDA
jgi:hypothetical protein